MMSGTLGVIGGTLGGGGSSTLTPSYVAWEMSSVVTTTASSTPHVKGSWVEAVASTAADCDQLLVHVANVYASGTDTAQLLDIGVGSSGSESVIVGNIGIGGAYANNYSYPYLFRLPISIPSGSRVAIRNQALIPSDTAAVSLHGIGGGGFDSPTTATAMGTSTSTSAGTELGTAWTEIVASTAATYRYLVAVPSLSTASSSTSSDPIVVGTGTSGSEVEIGSIPTSTNTLEMVFTVAYPAPQWTETCVLPGCPAGTRIVAKRAAACDVTIIGIP